MINILQYILVEVDIVVSIDNLLLFQSAKEITPSSKDAKYSLDSLILVFYLSKEIDFDLNKELLLINKVLEVDNQLVYDKAIADGKTPEEAEAMKQKIKDNSVLGSYLTSFTDAIEKIKESGGGEIKFQASEQIYLNEYLLPFAKYYSDPEYKQEIKELTPEQSLSNTIQRIYVKFDLKTADDVFYTYHSYFDITIKSVINVSSGSYRMKPGSEINLFDSAYVDSIASVSFTSVIDTQDTAEEKTDYKDDTSLFIITPTTLSLALVDSKKAEEMIDKVFKIDILIQDKLGNSLTLTLYVTIAKNVETYTYIKQETPYYITSGTTASLLNNKIGILSYRGSDCVEVAKSSNPYGTFTFESESDMVVIYGSDILASDVLYDTSVLIKATYNDKTDNTMYSFYFNVVIKNEYSFISNDMVTLSSGAKGTYRVVNDGDVVDLTKIITVMKGEDEINNLNVTYSSDNAELEGCFDTENSTLTIPKGSVGKFFTINCMYTNGVQYKFVSYIIKVADLTYSFEMKDDTSVYIVQSGQTLNLDTVKGVFKDNNGNQITGEYKFLQYYHKQDENDDSEVGVCYYSIYTSADDGMQKLIARPVYSDITTFVIVQLTSAKNEVYLGTFKINILSTYKIVTENVTASVDGGVNTRVSSAADALDKKINYFDFGNNFVLNDTYRNVDYSDEKITILRNKNPNVDPADIERTFTFIYDEVDVSAALVDVGSGKKSYIVDGAEHFTIENNIVTFSAYASGHKLGIVATYFAIYDYDEDETYIGGSISSRIDITIVQNRFISLMKSDIEAAKLINGDYDVVVKYDYEFININREFTTPSYTEDGDGVATYTFQNVNESGETVTMFTLSEGALSFTENARPYKLQIVGGGETKEIIINEFMERGYILSQDVSNSNAAVLAAYTYKFVSAIPTASLLSDGVTTSYSCGAREMFTVKDNKLKFTNQSSYAAGAYRLQITSSYIFEGLDDRTYSSVQIVEPENQTSSILLDANNTMDVFNNQMKTGFDLRYLFRLVDKEGYMIEMNRDDFLIYVNNNLIASDSENFSSSDSFILKLGAGSGRKVVKIVDKYLQNYVQYSGWIG